MDPQLTGLKKIATTASKRAASLFVVAQQIMVADNCSPDSLFAALELKSRAIEECRRAINTIDFIRRYEPAQK